MNTESHRTKKRIGVSLRRYCLLQSPCWKYRIHFGLRPHSFRHYIQFQFRDGMTWDNFGSVWQFDHIISCCDFGASLEEEQLCWSWLNIRPLALQTNKARNSYSEACIIFQNMKAKFGDQEVFNRLVDKAENLRAKQSDELVDWSEFEHFTN